MIGERIGEIDNPLAEAKRASSRDGLHHEVPWVHEIRAKERSLVFASKPLEATMLQVENIKRAYVFHESGLSMNVL